MTQRPSCDLGLIGLAVMGQNLVLNMADHGFHVAVFNRTPTVVDAFLAGPAKDRPVACAGSLPELVEMLKRPRRVMLMVKAGAPVDDLIERLIPLLEPGDVIIDGGNSFFQDSMRRSKSVEEKGIRYVGMGVSGGEEGARHGPSIMPGGSAEAWPVIREIFQAIAAKVEDGSPCCEWVGESGSGHFVKMVHNGIEYGDMQLIAESYHLMKAGLGLTNEQMAQHFEAWNQGKLGSYLVEITRDILLFKDRDGLPLLDKILDTAGQKGTGRWASDTALEMGVPLSLITEAVLARSLSAQKQERVQASRVLGNRIERCSGDAQAFVDELGQALYAAKIVSYAQGFMLLRAAAQEYHWNLNYGEIALLWRGGCIIRSVFLGRIKDAFASDPQLSNLLLDPYFCAEIQQALPAWRHVVAQAVSQGIPVPALSSALSFYDGYRQDVLPANLIQAQRDYFGAHGYERLDRPVGTPFHTDWTGSGGRVTAGSYRA
jgi:6-phosphogluconate dehydrogenase